MKFEYQVVNMRKAIHERSSGGDQPWMPLLVAELAALGDQGWQLVSNRFDDDGFMIFMRQKSA